MLSLRPDRSRRPAPRLMESLGGRSAGAALLLLAALVIPTPTAAASPDGWATALQTRAESHPMALDDGASAALGDAATTATGPFQAVRGRFEGTLERLVEETVSQGRSIEQFFLVTSAGRLELHFDGAPPARFDNGARVRVTGKRIGNVVQVDAEAAGTDGLAVSADDAAADGSAAGTEVLADSPGSGTGARRLGVVPINFTNDRSRPFSRAYANGVYFTNTRSARSYFAEESKGRVSVSGTTFDWIELPVSNATCDPFGWAAAARQILSNRGVDVASYTNFAFVFPQTNSCGWRGLGHLPGWHTWVNGTPGLRTAVHELGHNFGAHHASSMTCRANGSRVALSPNCTTSEYGDPFTTMGAADRRVDHNEHLAQLGYIDPTATRTITASGTYILTKSQAITGIRVMRIARGDGTYFYLEYRRPSGTLYDDFRKKDPAVRGVTIRIAGDWSQIIQTKLIDTRPGTATFADAPLRVGHSFHDYRSGVTMTLVDRGRKRAWVKISFPPDRTPPTAAGSFTTTASTTSSITLAWTAASDNRAVAGYRIWRNGTLAWATGAAARVLQDPHLLPGTTYSYVIRAFDAAGNVGPALSLTASTKAIDLAPAAPVATIVAGNGHGATLSWTAATDDHGVASYEVFRDGVSIGTVGANVLELDVTADTAGYTVVAYDTAGQASPPSNEVRLSGG